MHHLIQIVATFQIVLPTHSQQHFQCFTKTAKPFISTPELPDNTSYVAGILNVDASFPTTALNQNTTTPPTHSPPLPHAHRNTNHSTCNNNCMSNISSNNNTPRTRTTFCEMPRLDLSHAFSKIDVCNCSTCQCLSLMGMKTIKEE